MSRQGKHKEGKVSIGIYVDEDFRALLALVVDQSGETATDVIMDGVRAKATSLGILKDGVIVEEYRPSFELIKAAYAEKKGAKKHAKK
jgi:hypothetical protein